MTAMAVLIGTAVVMAGGQARAGAPSACDVEKLTCTTSDTASGWSVECQVPAALDAQALVVSETVRGRAVGARELQRTGTCTFHGDLGYDITTFAVTARDRLHRLVAESAARDPESHVAGSAPQVHRFESSSAAAIPAEALGGALAGLVGGTAGVLVFAFSSPDILSPNPTGLFFGAGIAVTSVTLGICEGGQLAHRSGSGAATFGGVLLGAIAGAEVLDHERHTAGGVAMVALPLAGGIAGFTLTDRGDNRVRPVAIGSAIVIDRGQLRLGVPVPISAHGETSMSLLSGRF